VIDQLLRDAQWAAWMTETTTTLALIAGRERPEPIFRIEDLPMRPRRKTEGKRP
jgi:hypothetical protein